jgi:hypothetical protein
VHGQSVADMVEEAWMHTDIEGTEVLSLVEQFG